MMRSSTVPDLVSAAMDAHRFKTGQKRKLSCYRPRASESIERETGIGAVSSSSIEPITEQSGGRSSFRHPGTRRQYRQHDRDQQQSGNISEQMPAMLGVNERLRRHDDAVHDAGPDGEPDK